MSDEPTSQGNLEGPPATEHELLLNARAAGAPADLQRIVEAQLAAIPYAVEIRAMQCFSPSPPKPERRLDYVVS